MGNQRSAFEELPHNPEGESENMELYIKSVENCDEKIKMEIRNGKNIVKVIPSKIKFNQEKGKKAEPKMKLDENLFTVPLCILLDDNSNPVDTKLRVKICNDSREDIFCIDLNTKVRDHYYEKTLKFANLGNLLGVESKNFLDQLNSDVFVKIKLKYILVKFGNDEDLEKAFVMNKLGSENYGFEHILMMIMEHFTTIELLRNFFPVSKHFCKVIKNMVPLESKSSIHIAGDSLFEANGTKIISQMSVLEFKFREIHLIIWGIYFFDDTIQLLNNECMKILSFSPPFDDLFNQRIKYKEVEEILSFFPKLEDFSTGYVINKIKESEKKFNNLKIFRYRSNENTESTYSYISKICPNLEYFQYEGNFCPDLKINKNNLKKYHTFNFNFDNYVRKTENVRFLDLKTGINYLVEIKKNDENNGIAFLVFNMSNKHAIKMNFAIEIKELDINLNVGMLWYRNNTGKGLRDIYKNIDKFLNTKDWNIRMKTIIDEVILDEYYENFIENEGLKKKEIIQKLPIGITNEVILETDENNIARFNISSMDCFLEFRNICNMYSIDEAIKKYVKKFKHQFYLHLELGRSCIVRMSYTLTPLLKKKDIGNIVTPIFKNQVIDYTEGRNWGMSSVNLNRWFHEKVENILKKHEIHRFKLEYTIINAWDNYEDYTKCFSDQYNYLKKRIESSSLPIVEKGSIIIKSKDLKKKVSIQSENFKICDLNWFLEVYPNYKIDSKGVFNPGVSMEVYHIYDNGVLSITGDVKCKINGKEYGTKKKISEYIFFPSVSKSIENDLNIELEFMVFDVKINKICKK